MNPPLEEPTKKRLLSLDAMRGLTMASMILVNNPGSWSHIYPPLEHAVWHGWTPTDLIFPFFLFMVGVAMPFSFEKRLSAGGRAGLMMKVVQRTLILILLGLFLGVFPEVLWRPGVVLEARWPGVLQRIAIGYFFTSLAVMFLPNLGRWAVATCLLVVYSALMWFYPVPEYGPGVFEVTGNFCWWLDNQLLFGHTWKGAPAEGFDPEGVWSTLPAITTCLLGYFTGQQLRSESDNSESDKWQMLTRLFVAANICLVLAYGVSLSMPINKQLWTTSFVFLTAGLAIHLLGVLYYFIDLREYRRGLLPMLVFGSNAIFAYVLSSLVGDLISTIPVGGQSLKAWLYTYLSANWLSPNNASLVMAIMFVLVCFTVTYMLHIRRIFIRI